MPAMLYHYPGVRSGDGVDTTRNRRDMHGSAGIRILLPRWLQRRACRQRRVYVTNFPNLAPHTLNVVALALCEYI